MGSKSIFPVEMMMDIFPRVPLLLLVACRHLDHGRLSSTLCPGD
jgi:hypothetical protein